MVPDLPRQLSRSSSAYNKGDVELKILLNQILFLMGKDQDARSGSVYTMLSALLLGWYVEYCPRFYAVRATNQGGRNGEEWCLERAICFPRWHCIPGGDGIVYDFMSYGIAREILKTFVSYTMLSSVHIGSFL